MKRVGNTLLDQMVTAIVEEVDPEQVILIRLSGAWRRGREFRHRPDCR